MNKVLIPVLAVVAAGSATFGFIQMNAAGDLEKERDNLKGKLAQQESALETALKERKQALADLEFEKGHLAQAREERDQAKAKAKELAASAEKNAGLAEAGTPAAGAGGRNEEAMKRITEGIDEFRKRMDAPENRDRMKTGIKDGIARGYSALYTKLGLSEENSQLVSDLISDRTMAMIDKSRKMMEGGATSDVVKKDMEATKAEYDTKLKAVLGEEKFNELNTHEQTMGDQRSLDRIARNFESKSAPLQAEQRTVLSNIMREERMKLPSNGMMDLGGGGGLGFLLSDGDTKAQQQQDEAYQTEVMKRASTQAGLSPDQVNLLQENFNRQNKEKADARAFGGLVRPFLNGAGRARQ